MKRITLTCYTASRKLLSLNSSFLVVMRGSLMSHPAFVSNPQNLSNPGSARSHPGTPTLTATGSPAHHLQGSRGFPPPLEETSTVPLHVGHWETSHKWENLHLVLYQPSTGPDIPKSRYWFLLFLFVCFCELFIRKGTEQGTPKGEFEEIRVLKGT